MNQRTLHDQVALSLALIPLVFFRAMIITAPTAIYPAIRKWYSPSSILPRTKVRFVIAISIGALQILGRAALPAHRLT
jgi:predicted permease